MLSLGVHYYHSRPESRARTPPQDDRLSRKLQHFNIFKMAMKFTSKNYFNEDSSLIFKRRKKTQPCKVKMCFVNSRNATIFKKVMSGLPVELQLLVMKMFFIHYVPIEDYASMCETQDPLLDSPAFYALSERTLDLSKSFKEFTFFGQTKGIKYCTPQFRDFASLASRLGVVFAKAAISGSFRSMDQAYPDAIWLVDNSRKLAIHYPRCDYQEVMSVVERKDRPEWTQKLINVRTLFSKDSGYPEWLDKLTSLEHIDVVVHDLEELTDIPLSRLKHMLVKARKSATLILENCNYYDIPEDIMNLVESISNSNIHTTIS
ncbi:unnamed protein product [Ambrosiozyma monospora]|uniref:Unnamed protein product n=1 Tax=Ambrosiozyma monospora TaxID=43982 RepID=A0ACB5U5F8_AMBMO|nr:unnamed protein product [Ambrosiozyma monospora]